MFDKISSYLNPFSEGFHQATVDFGGLSKGEKVLTVTLSAIAGVGTFFFLGVGGYATFKSLVDTFKVNPLEPEDDPTTEKASTVATKRFSSEIDDEKTTLLNKLPTKSPDEKPLKNWSTEPSTRSAETNAAKKPLEINQRSTTTASATSPKKIETEVPQFSPQLNQYLADMRSVDSLNDRTELLKKMPFETVSQVALEVRQSIIDKVRQEVPKDKNVLFLIGGTGAGKSTALCAFCGDKMVLVRDHYESADDKEHVIQHSASNSGTLLPNIRVNGEWAFVDFPGFEDTRGQAIAMGVEFALKELLDEFKPKVLVLESIKNTENRSAGTAKLGEMVTRLMDKENCTLGLTKYSEVPDFIALADIEKKETLLSSQKSDEELDLEIAIDVITKMITKPLPQNVIESRIKVLEQKKERLKEIQNEKAQKPQIRVVDNENYKNKLRSNLKIKENEILSQMELQRLIRLDTLDNPASILETLKETGPVSVNPERKLDAEHERLIQHLFENDLIKKMHNSNLNISLHDFHQNIENISLTKTLLSQNPEIGEFLHLPEMDPKIVRDFEIKFINSALDQTIGSMIDIVDNLKQEDSKNTSVDSFKKQKIKYQDFLLGIEGIEESVSKNPNTLAFEWNKMREKYTSKTPSALSPFLLSQLNLSDEPNDQNIDAKIVKMQKLIADLIKTSSELNKLG